MTRKLRLTYNIFFLFVIISLVFPTIRLLSIGSAHASGTWSQLFAFFPEILFLCCIFLAFLSRPENRLKWNVIDYIVMIYMTIIIVSGLLIGREIVPAIASIRMTYLPMIAYFIFSGLQWNSVDLLRLIKNLSIALTVVGGIGYLLYFIFPGIQLYLHHLFTHLPQDEYFFIRMTSIIYTPVVFGALMAFAYLFWAWNYLQSGKLLFLLLAVFAFSCIMMSVSRGPVLASGIASGLMILVLQKWKNGVLLFLGCAVVIVIIGTTMANLGEFLAWFYSSTGETISGSSGQTRVSLWKETSEMLSKHPLGVGLGKAGHVAFQHFPEGTPDVSRGSTDGWYLKLAVESGIQAFIMYLIVFTVFLVSFVKNIRRKNQPMSVFVLSIFVFMAFLNIVSNGLDFGVFSYLYWAVLGIFVHLIKKTETRVENIGSHSEL